MPKVYKPFQHTVKPLGCDHLTCFANTEVWMDDLPFAIEIGGLRWIREDLLSPVAIEGAERRADDG